jgi:hypothetical protein
MGVPTKFEFLFWDFEVTYPPISRVLIVVVCLFLPIVHHLQDIGGMKI